MVEARVLLHGLPFDARVWTGVIAALEGPCWAPSLPGYGNTPPLTRGWRVTDHVDWLEAAARAAGLPDWSRVAVVGHEYGGLMAAELACRHRVGELRLMSTALGPSWLAARVAAWPGLHRILYRWQGGRRYRDHAVAPSDRAALAAAFPMPGTVAFAEMMRQTGRGLGARHLAGLEGRLSQQHTGPLGLVWGTEDRTFPPAVGRRLGRRLGAEVRWIPGARHLAPWTHPAGVAAAIATRPSAT